MRLEQTELDDAEYKSGASFIIEGYSGWQAKRNHRGSANIAILGAPGRQLQRGARQCWPALLDQVAHAQQCQALRNTLEKEKDGKER